VGVQVGEGKRILTLALTRKKKEKKKTWGQQEGSESER